MNFESWLRNQYARQAVYYRIVLQREINATNRIFNTITPDVKDMLHKALREINRRRLKSTMEIEKERLRFTTKFLNPTFKIF